MHEEPVRHTEVTCVACGRVSIAMSTAEVEASVAEFNRFYESLPEERRRNYGGPSSAEKDYRCMGCGGTSFRMAVEGDCPAGCTLGPVLCDELAASA